MPSSSATPVNVNMEMAERIVIATDTLPWLPSPSAHVQRKILAREQQEGGHATSIVRYDAGAKFPPHDHPRGEEIFVLEGIFSDAKGDYPAGTYLRNPPGTSHAPFSRDGCVLFVKLHQFDVRDLTPVVVNTLSESWRQGYGNLQVMPLHQFEAENVALVKWPAGEIFQPHTHFGGEEILVLRGAFCDEHGRYPVGSWIRSPHLSSHTPYVEEETVILVKTGHL